jgi:hypothetical protein
MKSLTPTQKQATRLQPATNPKPKLPCGSEIGDWLHSSSDELSTTVNQTLTHASGNTERKRNRRKNRVQRPCLSHSASHYCVDCGVHVDLSAMAAFACHLSLPPEQGMKILRKKKKRPWCYVDLAQCEPRNETCDLRQKCGVIPTSLSATSLSSHRNTNAQILSGCPGMAKSLS